MVSMMQTIQSGARPTFYPGRVDWPTPDGSQLGFTNRGADGELRNVGVLVDIGLAQGMELDDDLELLFVMTEDLLDATKDNMRVAAGRRADPAGGYHGYVVWQRRRTPNHPRMEISPDQVITLWYHWPNGDDQPLQLCPASTIFAGSCCNKMGGLIVVYHDGLGPAGPQAGWGVGQLAPPNRASSYLCRHGAAAFGAARHLRYPAAGRQDRSLISGEGAMRRSTRYCGGAVSALPALLPTCSRRV